MAWQVISVTDLSPVWMTPRPEPVVTVAVRSAWVRPACWRAWSRARWAPLEAPAPVGRMTLATMVRSWSRMTTSVVAEPLSMPAK